MHIYTSNKFITTKSLSDNYFSFCDNTITNGNVEFTIFGKDHYEAEVGQGRWAQGEEGEWEGKNGKMKTDSKSGREKEIEG